jgi:hypothetical protein
MADKTAVKVDLTTGIGTLSFPHIFASTKSKNEKGEDSYDIQIIIPKSQREDVRAILRAIKEVGFAKWGENWKKVRTPLRDGDKEKDELTEDGSTKGEKYPERLGCFFLNARSTKPVGVYDRTRTPITNPDDVYGGCKGKINVTFYAYSQQGNHGVAAGLNGVQKIADGEAFGGGRPSVESMFDMLDEDDDLGLDEGVDEDFENDTEPEPTPAPAKKAAAKRAPAKKAAAKPAPVPEPEEEDDEDDLYDDLDDLDD